MKKGVLRLGLAVALLLATPLVSAAAPEGCGVFVDTYLRSGLPSGSTVDVALGSEQPSSTTTGNDFRKTFSNANLSGESAMMQSPLTLRLDYPRYPAVAGVLIGHGVSLGLVNGELALGLDRADHVVTLRPVRCDSSGLVFSGGADEASEVTVAVLGGVGL